MNLRPRIASHLDELCDLLGATRTQIVESLVEREYAARQHLAIDRCPWRISAAAIDDYLDIARSDDADAARVALEAAAVDAIAAEHEGRRLPVVQANGALRYRGPKPRRLVLFVQHAGTPRATLVGVSIK